WIPLAASPESRLSSRPDSTSHKQTMLPTPPARILPSGENPSLLTPHGLLRDAAIERSTLPVCTSNKRSCLSQLTASVRPSDARASERIGPRASVSLKTRSCLPVTTSQTRMDEFRHGEL